MFSFFKRKKDKDNQEPSSIENSTIIPETQDRSSDEGLVEVEIVEESVEETVDDTSLVNTKPDIDPAPEDAIEEASEAIIDTVIEESIEAVLEDTHDSAVELASSPEPIVVEESVAIAVEDLTADAEPVKEKTGWAARLKQGLSKSRDKLGKSLAGVFGGGQIDDELYEDLEAVLLTSDMGIDATEHLLKEVRERVSLKGLKDATELKLALKEALSELLQPLEAPLEIPSSTKPFVIMMVGVNGAGKTTSIGKLAKHFQQDGKEIILAAGDTFRAAAREQLLEWGKRNDVTVISQASGDSAAVCYDALEAAKARNVDILLADTAGRLPSQLHLMEEIKKVKRVIQKSSAQAPHEIILVLDANIGQNTINQVVAFDDALGLSGLILTKLDGTAKGGVIAALAKNRPIPVRYIGVGEGIDDLRPFKVKEFVDALLD